MINENPLLGPQWEPLGQVLTRLLESLKGYRTFSAQTYGRVYGMSPYRSPYLQAVYDEDARLQMEVSGNLQVKPALTEEQMQMLEFYGWLRPEVAPEEYQGGNHVNPNFTRYFDAGTEPSFISEFILTTLVGVYGITEEDFWGFDGGQANTVDALKKLGRLKVTEGNPDGVIFAMPGKHFELLES